MMLSILFLVITVAAASPLHTIETHNLAILSRDSKANTTVSLSDRRVNYGKLSPDSIIEEIRDKCGSISCDEKSFKITTKVADGSSCPKEKKLKVMIDADYENDSLDSYLELLREALSKKVDIKKTEYSKSNNWGISCTGTIEEHIQSGFVAIRKEIQNDDSGKQGTFKITIEDADEDDSTCKGIGAADALVSAVKEDLSGPVGDFFGIVDAICDLASD